MGHTFIKTPKIKTKPVGLLFLIKTKATTFCQSEISELRYRDSVTKLFF